MEINKYTNYYRLEIYVSVCSYGWLTLSFIEVGGVIYCSLVSRRMKLKWRRLREDELQLRETRINLYCVIPIAIIDL